MTDTIATPNSIRKAIPLTAPAPVIAIKFINKDHAFRIGRLKPKQIELVEKLPLTWLGKPSRQALVAEELRRLNASVANGAAAAQAPAAAEPATAA